MENLTLGDLHIDVVPSGAGDPIRLVWTGKSTDRHPAKILVPYFKAAVLEAVERNVALEMHFDKLSYFNSSTISSLIQGIQDARSNRTKLVLIYDEHQKWQRLSFDALRVFAKDDLFELKSI